MDEQIADTSTMTAPPVTQEKMLPQSEVNALVGRVRAEERERQAQAIQAQQQAQAPQHQHQGFGEQDVRRLAAEETQRLRNEWAAELQGKADQDYAGRIVKNFWEKVDAEKGKYEDFESVTGDIALENFPNVVQLLAEHVDNSGDILYEFGKNRLRLSQFEILARESPKDAIHAAKRLAKSIKDNNSAGNTRSANSPLTQQRPSNTGTDPGKVMTVTDYRKRYKV